MNAESRLRYSQPAPRGHGERTFLIGFVACFRNVMGDGGPQRIDHEFSPAENRVATLGSDELDKTGIRSLR